MDFEQIETSIEMKPNEQPGITVSQPTPAPSFVQIEPVGQCNLACTMCAIPYRQDGPPYGPPAFMAFELFTRLIDQLPGTKELHLQGLGEPFMHPRFFEMVAYASARGMRVTTNTNLTLLNPRRAEDCIRSGLNTLHISIDAASAAVYENIRVKGRFDRVLHNLELLRMTRQRLGGNLPHFKLVAVAMKQNLMELPELVELAARYGMEEMFVQHLSHDFSEESLPAQYMPMRNFVNGQTLLSEDLSKIELFFGLARERAEDLGIKLRLPRPRPRPFDGSTPGRMRCSWPWTGMYISYQGLSMPCCMVSTPDRINFGNVAEEHGIQKVWNGVEYQQFRDALSSTNPPDICKSCSIYKGIF
ncbi:MAG TPA: radical SAM protein [Anaerolineaceae bacterium]|nr:radical SAM protein [Anaerolineaceae bacterium]